MTKEFTGEKYIYFLMAYELAHYAIDKSREVGSDNGYIGAYKYERRFRIQEYNGKTLLTEYKSSPSSADFSRTVEVDKAGDRPVIRPYINEDGEDGYKTWVH